jgi:hypothetical protein
MSGMAAAYYERCTEKYLSTLYEQTVTGWQCKCGATFNTHDAVDHKCPITHPHLFQPTRNSSDCPGVNQWQQERKMRVIGGSR